MTDCVWCGKEAGPEDFLKPGDECMHCFVQNWKPPPKLYTLRKRHA